MQPTDALGMGCSMTDRLIKVQLVKPIIAWKLGHIELNSFDNYIQVHLLVYGYELQFLVGYRLQMQIVRSEEFYPWYSVAHYLATCTWEKWRDMWLCESG